MLARQKPVWPPGARQAYHSISIGFYEGELLRRVDPRHRSLGQFFQDEIASPLALDFFIRLPEEIPNSRLGAPGAGGAMGFADPRAGIGYGYVTNRMGTSLTGDPRDVALRDALYAVIGARDGPYPGRATTRRLSDRWLGGIACRDPRRYGSTAACCRASDDECDSRARRLD